MKTKLEELMEQASPLPWHFADSWIGVPDEAYSESEQRAMMKILSNKLLADHAVNTLPKVLDAIKDYLNHDCPETGQCGGSNAIANGFTYMCVFRRILEDALAEANNPPTHATT